MVTMHDDLKQAHQSQEGFTNNLSGHQSQNTDN